MRCAVTDLPTYLFPTYGMQVVRKDERPGSFVLSK